MAAQATWMPSTEYGEIHNRAELPESVFAFPRQRKEPLTDASHVKNAVARFDQVEGVSDADRELRQYQEGCAVLRRRCERE